MTNEYLLPCDCGHSNRVGARQAGETIECACGARLDVPTMREMRRLEPVVEGAARHKTAWGPRQGLAFLGLLVAALGLAAGGYFYFIVTPRPTDFAATQAQLDSIGPADAWQYWKIVRKGIPLNLTGEAAESLEQARKARWGIRVSLGLTAAGLALAASGLLLKTRTV